MIDSADANHQGWLGVEMLLHEACHGLTDALSNAIATEAQAAGKKDEGVLSHIIQFHVVGELMRRVLATDGVMFSPYKYATGIFDRPWKRFRPGVESEISAYLDGKQAIDIAVRRIVNAALE